MISLKRATLATLQGVDHGQGREGRTRPEISGLEPEIAVPTGNVRGACI